MILQLVKDLVSNKVFIIYRFSLILKRVREKEKNFPVCWFYFVNLVVSCLLNKINYEYVLE